MSRCMRARSSPISLDEAQALFAQVEMAKTSANMKRHRARLAKKALRKLRARLHPAQFKPPMARQQPHPRQSSQGSSSRSWSADGAAAPWEAQTIDWDAYFQCTCCMEIISRDSVLMENPPVCPECGSKLEDTDNDIE